MQIVEHLNQGLKRAYHVTFPLEVVSRTYDLKYAELAKTAKTPGFRPGKVPQHVLKQRYHDRVRHDVLKDLFEQGTQKALERSNARAAETPRVEVEKEGDHQDLSFIVHMELLPEIKLQPIDAFNLERVVYQVSTEDVETELNAMAQRFRDWTPADTQHKAQVGDQALLRLSGIIDGQSLGLDDQKIYAVELGQGLTSPGGHAIPGFDDTVIHHKVGDSWETSLSFPQDYGFQEWAGKTAIFHMTLTELKCPCPIDVSDAFAQKQGFDTLIELREVIRHHLQKAFDERTFLLIKRQLLDALAEQYGDVLVPENLARQEFNSIWTEFTRYLQQSGETMMSTEDTQQEYMLIAERRVRLGLVLSEIGQKEGITVQSDELKQAIMETAQRYPGQEAEILKFYQNNPQALQSVQAPLFENKVVRSILSQNKIEVRTISKQELIHAEELLEASPVRQNPQTKSAKDAKKSEKSASATHKEESLSEKEPSKPRKKAKTSS